MFNCLTFHAGAGLKQQKHYILGVEIVELRTWSSDMSSDNNDVNYERDDFPEHYLKMNRIYEEEGEDYCVPGESSLGRFYIARVMRFLHQFFASGKHSDKSLMDMCCGPTIHSVMSASKYYEKIYLTEFAAVNRRAVEMWIKQDPSFNFDWRPHLKFVAHQEGCLPENVEDRLRSRIQGVYPCDLTADQPLGEFRPPPVDCLVSVLTLESPAKTRESYSSLLKKMVYFIRPGGVLLLCGILRSKYYIVNEIKYDNLYLEESFVRSCLVDARLEVEEYVEYPVPPSNMANPGRSYFMLSAQKAWA